MVMMSLSCLKLLLQCISFFCMAADGIVRFPLKNRGNPGELQEAGKQEYFMTSLNNRVKKGILKMWFKKLRSLPEVPTGRKALQ
jgi:hypothetical protein